MKKYSFIFVLFATLFGAAHADDQTASQSVKQLCIKHMLVTQRKLEFGDNTRFECIDVRNPTRPILITDPNGTDTSICAGGGIFYLSNDYAGTIYEDDPAMLAVSAKFYTTSGAPELEGPVSWGGDMKGRRGRAMSAPSRSGEPGVPVRSGIGTTSIGTVTGFVGFASSGPGGPGTTISGIGGSGPIGGHWSRHNSPQSQPIPTGTLPLPLPPKVPSNAAVLGARPLLTAGDYRASKFSTSVLFAPNDHGKVRIFLYDGPDSPPVFEIPAVLSLSNGANFEILYAGNRPIRFKGQQVCGVIYAPHAAVHIDRNQTVSGAIAADSVECDGNNTFQFDPSWKDMEL